MQEPEENQKSRDPRRYRTVLTFGGHWSDLFEDSLARKMAAIRHFQVGSPKFKLNSEDIPDLENKEDFLTRMNSNTTQASELVWKFSSLLALSDIVLIDTKLLDTAIGQFLLMESKQNLRSCWAVGVDAALSPLAPYYLKGVMYPSTSDDLVKLVLQEIA